MKLGFINDKTDRIICKLINKYKIPVNFISTPNKSLSNTLKYKQNMKKHKNCAVCDILPDKVKCNNRFLVYINLPVGTVKNFILDRPPVRLNLDLMNINVL